MEKEQYLLKLKEINNTFESSKNALYREFALSNAIFKTGDMIKDHRYTFIIDKITVSKFGEYPEPVYQGYELTKDLKLRKDKKRCAIYGNNGIELVNKE